MMIKKKIMLAALILSTSLAGQAATRLTALPEKGDVRIDMTSSIPLFEEDRILTLQKGDNDVTFAWNGVIVDPSSIRITLLSPKSKVTLVNSRTQIGSKSITWKLNSTAALEQKIRISYLLGKIDYVTEYRAETDEQEKNLTINAYVVFRNFSGQKLQDADLAAAGGKKIYTSLDNQETKKVKTGIYKVPIKKTLLWDSSRITWEPKKATGNVAIPLYYHLQNNKSNGLGLRLNSGKIRVYQASKMGNEVFLGEDTFPLTPKGSDAKFTIGSSRDVQVTQKQTKRTHTNIRRNNNNRVVLHDEDVEYTVTIKNFKNKTSAITLLERFNKDHRYARLRQNITSSAKDKKGKKIAVQEEFRGIKDSRFTLDLPAKSEVTLTIRYTLKNCL